MNLRVNWRHLLFYLALLEIPYPNKKELNDYRGELLRKSKDENEIEMKDFLEVKY